MCERHHRAGGIDHKHLRVAVDDASRVCPDPIVSRGGSALSETLHRPPTFHDSSPKLAFRAIFAALCRIVAGPHSGASAPNTGPRIVGWPPKYNTSRRKYGGRVPVFAQLTARRQPDAGMQERAWINRAAAARARTHAYARLSQARARLYEGSR